MAAVARIEQALAKAGADLDSLFTGADERAPGDPRAIRSFVNNVIALGNTVTGLTHSLQGHLSPAPVMSERVLSFLAGGLVLLSLGGLWRTAHSDSRNTRLAVARLTDEAKGLAQGNLTVKARITGDVTAPVANSINSAVSQMRGLVSGIRQAAGEVSQAAARAAEFMVRLKNHRTFQSSEISDCAAGMMNLSDRIYRASQSAVASMPQVRKYTKLAQQGMNTLRDTAQRMDTASNQVQKTGIHLQRLNEGCLQIRDIVDSMQDMTEQTHTLSLNACIQATSAPGPDFAGTAEEIRSLAQRSTHALNEIAELVEGLRQEADHAMTCIQAVNREAASGTAGADRTRGTLQEIETLSRPLPEIVDQLSDELENELKLLENAAKRMQKLQDSTAKAWLDVSGIAVALEKTKLAANRLERTSGGFTLPEPRSGNG